MGEALGSAGNPVRATAESWREALSGPGAYFDFRAQLPLAQGDISVLMGNLLDNACEAAGRAPEKKISVRILRQGNYVSICVENTVEAPVLAKNPGLETTKEDRSLHGLGTKNIRKIVEKYGGMMEYREEGKLFICDILIPFDTSYGV